MKTFDQLTGEEILKLTEDQIDMYVKRACAEKGVPILVPPKKLTRPKFEKTKIIYAVKDLFFDKKEIAEKVCELLNSNKEYIVTKNYNYQVGYNYHYAEPITYDFTVDPVFVFERELFLAKMDELIKCNKAEEDFKNSESEYKKYLEEVSVIKSWIYEKYYELRDEKEKLERKKENYKEYLKLAENDEELAKKFFIKAFPDLDKKEMELIFNKDN